MGANENFIKETRKVKAFTCQGIDYYQFTDGGLPITYMRLKAAQETISIASELRISEEVLDEFQDMIDVFSGKRTGDHRVLSMTKEDLQAQLVLQNDILRQRRMLSSGLEVMYILASIFYFDESEDPAQWDRSHARKKIKIWQGNHEIEAFFLQSLPLDSIISSELFQHGTVKYLQEMYIQLYTHSNQNYQMLSDEEKESEAGQNIALLAETYKSLIHLAELGLLNIMTT